MMRAWCYSLLLFIPVSLLSMQSNSKAVMKRGRDESCSVLIPSQYSAFRILPQRDHALMDGMEKLASAIKKPRIMESDNILFPVVCDDQYGDAKEQRATDTLVKMCKESHLIKSLIKKERKQCSDKSRKITVHDEDGCSMCCDGNSLCAWNKYNHHVRMHYACLECKVKFSSQEIIALHLINHHHTKRSLINDRIAKIKDYAIGKILQEMMDQYDR